MWSPPSVSLGCNGLGFQRDTLSRLFYSIAHKNSLRAAAEHHHSITTVAVTPEPRSLAVLCPGARPTRGVASNRGNSSSPYGLPAALAGVVVPFRGPHPLYDLASVSF